MHLTIQQQLLTLIITVLLISGCSTLAHRQDSKLTNFYQHRWIDTQSPDKKLTVEQVARLMSSYDVVFFGEIHGHSAVHLAQMQLFEAMYRLNPKLGLSLEQFERDTQPLVDDYLAGKIGEEYLMQQARAWENYPSSYRPLVEFAKQHHLAVIAANAPKTDVVCVGRLGPGYLDSLESVKRQYVAQDIDLSDGDYRQQFMDFLKDNSSHGSIAGDGMSAMMKTLSERSYAAQVVRDETMAESIARHLDEHPEQQILHLNGVFHSHQFLGTVERLIKRKPAIKIAVIETVTIADGDESWKTEDLDSGNILLLVKQLPLKFVDKNHRKTWSKSILKQRQKSGQDCGNNDSTSSSPPA